jgi:hypothetical protein
MPRSEIIFCFFTAFHVFIKDNINFFFHSKMKMQCFLHDRSPNLGFGKTLHSFLEAIFFIFYQILFLFDNCLFVERDQGLVGRGCKINYYFHNYCYPIVLNRLFIRMQHSLWSNIYCILKYLKRLVQEKGAMLLIPKFWFLNIFSSFQYDRETIIMKIIVNFTFISYQTLIPTLKLTRRIDIKLYCNLNRLV